jgi:hypothetical protein
MGTPSYHRSPHNVLLWQFFIIIQVGRSFLQCRVGCGTLFALPYLILTNHSSTSAGGRVRSSLCNRQTSQNLLPADPVDEDESDREPSSQKREDDS